MLSTDIDVLQANFDCQEFFWPAQLMRVSVLFSQIRAQVSDGQARWKGALQAKVRVRVDTPPVHSHAP